MKKLYLVLWIIWPVGSFALFYGTPYPFLNFFAIVSLAVWVFSLGWVITDEKRDPWRSFMRPIYQALNENEPVHRVDLIRASKQAPLIVKLVLRTWEKKGLVNQKGGVYTITLAGQPKLKEEFDEA